MISYQDFKAQWLGKRVDYDHVFSYQCVDLILQFLYQCAGVGGGVWGNAIDYATKPTAGFLNATVRVTDGSKVAGDILVFKSPATPDGHITLRDTNLDYMLEQNGYTGNGSGTGKDAIGVYRPIPYDRLVAVYRIKQFVPAAPAPAEQAPAPAASGSFHVIKPIPGYGNSNNAANHISPIDTVQAGDYAIFNQAHGMVNVTSKPGQPGSWINPSDNVADPAPAPAPAAPQLPPKPANIAFTKLATPLNLIVNKNPTNAWHLDFVNDAHAVSAGQLSQGTPFTAVGKAQRTDGDKPCYYMTEADFGAADVTGIPNSNVGINTVDLSPAPAPAPVEPPKPETPTPAPVENEEVKVPVTVKSWKDSFVAEFGIYKATKDYTVTDLSGELPDTQLGHDQIVKVGGWVTKDGVEYAVSVKSHNLGHWYGVPKAILVQAPNTSGSKVIDAITHPAHTAQVVADDIEQIAADLSKDPEYAKFKSTLTPRGKLVADIAEAEDKVAGAFSKVNFFKRKYK